MTVSQVPNLHRRAHRLFVLGDADLYSLQEKETLLFMKMVELKMLNHRHLSGEHRYS